ncbi:MAG: hypothetical protein NWE85_04325 [Candidatus Bathyarchaeota archaeon]|nr:hypothetical protein [Candidatus Bathyarchaeota archaeon]
MRIISDVRAVSTFILIILILCSAVLGALISYMLVMSNYYNMPENTTLLIVENVAFPILDFTYFNVTILNPSNSASDVNITAIRLSVEGTDEIHDVTKTEPEPLPFLITIGTRLTFKCKENWSNFAGETVRIEPVTENASIRSCLYTTPKVKLVLIPNFDVSQSVEYFDLTIENSAQSIVNLTISEIKLFGTSINENVTPALPYVLSTSQRQKFQCNWNWESLRGQNVTITVKTAEGYETTYTTSKLLGVALYIPEVRFDYTDVTYFNLTISSSEDSTTTATIDRINLTLQDGTPVNINETFPPIGIPSIFNSVPPNQSRTFKCFWNWSKHRNETIAINAYTLEGFTIPSKTTNIPPTVVWNVTDVQFDLDDVKYFSVNVTNTPCSLHEINVTKILFDGNLTITNPPFEVLSSGEQITFNSTFDWKRFIGENITITVLTQDGLSVSKLITIPRVGLKLLDKPAISELFFSYINITISNSNNSLQNVTITKIIFETGNETYEIDGTLTYPTLAPDGYSFKTGEKVTIVCPWNWALYLGESLKVTIYTAEGFQVSEIWYLPFTP